MKTYHDRLVSESALYEMEENGGDFRATGQLTLATIARQPAVIAAVNRAREVANKDRWAALCRKWDATPAEVAAIMEIWNAMPGYCCMNDAASIAARL